MSTSRAILDSKKITGSVKWFDTKKGFGFIVPDSNTGISSEVFVHQTNIKSATGFRFLNEGMSVAFEARPDKTGRTQAYDVTMADGSPVKAATSNE